MLEFTEKLGIYAVATQMGKGVLPDPNPNPNPNPNPDPNPSPNPNPNPNPTPNQVKGNIHQFDALQDTAIFDVLSPPYDDLAGRSCHYYELGQVRS